MRVQLLWSSHIDTNVFALEGHWRPEHLNGTFWCRSDAYEHVKMTVFDALGMDPGSAAAKTTHFGYIKWEAINGLQVISNSGF